jgi:hypothetical protein
MENVGKDGELLLEANKKESKLYRVKGFTKESKIAKEMNGWHESLGQLERWRLRYLNV